MCSFFPRACALAVIVAGCAFVASAQQEPGRLELGFEQRIRNENWNNILDYSDAQNDEREQIRYRTRIWANVPLTRDVDFFAGLTQETNQKLGQVTHFDEVIFENAYLDFRKLFTRKLSLRIGRQNLIRGDGFILIDGGAGDGSRVMYMNAADLAYSFRKSKIEFLAILDPPIDRMLPRIHDQHRVLQNWTDRAYGAYFTSRDFRRTDIQAYYFYKSETGDITKCQPDRFVHTGGARVSRDLRKGWNLAGEFADQVGQQRGNVPIGAWGGYAYGRRTSEHVRKPYIQVGWYGFSGDDPRTTGRIEGWDPLFSRWPKWSELYIYSQMRETGVGYWTNSSMWQAEAGFLPHKKIQLRWTAYWMDAFHPNEKGDPRTFGRGTARGLNLQTRADFLLSPHWKAHAVYETHRPGDFYSERDAGYFFRVEACYQIRWRPAWRQASNAAPSDIVGGAGR